MVRVDEVDGVRGPQSPLLVGDRTCFDTGGRIRIPASRRGVVRP